jgi:hypothetical protein
MALTGLCYGIPPKVPPLNGGCCGTVSEALRELLKRLNVILVVSLNAHRICCERWLLPEVVG